MKVIDADIFTSDAYAVLHQVNCRGVMGSGIARQVKQKYPHVYTIYAAACSQQPSSKLLGKIQIVPASFQTTERYIVNLFAQEGYGRAGCYTDYDALRKCLQKVNINFHGKSIAIPYKMSCDRGGGRSGERSGRAVGEKKMSSTRKEVRIMAREQKEYSVVFGELATGHPARLITPDGTILRTSPVVAWVENPDGSGKIITQNSVYHKASGSQERQNKQQQT